jgi:hypothetical protein
MKKTELEKTQEALTEALAGLKCCYESGDTTNRTRAYIADVRLRINAILAPDPIETEDVTVVAWMFTDSGKIYGPYADEPKSAEGRENIKLTGTRTVEKKQPVVKSEVFTVNRHREVPFINFPIGFKARSATVTWEEPAE